MAKKQDKLKDFKKMDKKELMKLCEEKRENLRQFRFDLSAGKVKNVREIRETKKDIARIMTILNSNA